MTQYAVVIFWILIGLVVSQGLLVFGFVVALLRWRRPPLADEDCPKAAVILCLRGPDPFLPETLKAIFSQDYPRFDVRIVVDSREDPAWAIVQEAVNRSEATHVQIRPFTARHGTNSMKIGSMLQAISELDDSHEVVVLIDSDTVPHPNWLRELVAPLTDERVGVSSGNRWYMPTQPTWGALVRYVWNSAATVQMYWYGIAWGGSLALKTKRFHETDLLERLEHAFGEDSTICRTLLKHRLRIAFVPSLMMVNRETCSIPGFFHFLQRQLLTVRLHNPWWLAVVGHAISSLLTPIFTIGFIFYALLIKDWEAASWASGGLAVYAAAMPLLLAPLELCVRRIVLARGEATDWLKGFTVIKALCAIPLTQVVYGLGMGVSMFVRTHRWRGILYRFGGPGKVRVIEDRPYENNQQSGEDIVSL